MSKKQFKDDGYCIVKNAVSKELRDFITDTKCKCTYECAMSTNTLFNGNMFVRLLKQLTRDVLHR